MNGNRHRELRRTIAKAEIELLVRTELERVLDASDRVRNGDVDRLMISPIDD